MSVSAGMVLDLVTADEVSAAHAIEASVFPADEADSLEQFRSRQETAPFLFLGAFLPASSAGPSSRRKLIGYVCASRSNLPTLTKASMKKDDPDGSSICIHAVAVTATYQRRGIALGLLGEFVSRMRNLGVYKRVLLICHDDLRPLYEEAGFEHVGPSAVVHGALPWHEMRLVLEKPVNSVNYEPGTEIPQSSIDVVASGSAPQVSGPLPPGLLDALQHSSSSRNRPSACLTPSFANGLGDLSSSPQSGSTRKNEFDILCPHTGCGCIILKNGVGRLVEKEIPELEPTEKSPTTLLAPLPSPGSWISCWLIGPNPVAFENVNIGFSRAIERNPNTQGTRSNIKLLSCADCDLGPLGWCLEGGQEFWLVCTRVGYRT